LLLGAQNIKKSGSEEPYRKVYNITRKDIFQHPEYNENTISHDITVIRLPEKITFNSMPLFACKKLELIKYQSLNLFIN